MDERRKMTRMTISLDVDTKERLKAAAYEKRTTASALIQNFVWTGLVLKADQLGEK